MASNDSLRIRFLADRAPGFSASAAAQTGRRVAAAPGPFAPKKKATLLELKRVGPTNPS